MAFAHQADEALTKQAIDEALEAKKTWERMSWEDRACVFLKAADLIVSILLGPAQSCFTVSRCLRVFTNKNSLASTVPRSVPLL